MEQNIKKITENELIEYKTLLEDVFNNHIATEKMKKLYQQNIENQNIHILGLYNKLGYDENRDKAFVKTIHNYS